LAAVEERLLTLDGRAVLMADPNWKRGFYYDDLPPHTGMKLARRE
jgi:homoserine acetyltransferase